MAQGLSNGIRQEVRQGSKQGLAGDTLDNSGRRLSLSPTSFSVAPVATRQLAASLDVPGAGSSVVTARCTWSSSDATKATVNAAGLVTGVAAGTATITASFQTPTGTLTATSLATVA